MAFPSFQLPPSPPGRGKQRIAGATLAGLLALAVMYFTAFNVRMITLPGAQEAREASIPLTTGLLVAGGVPYNLNSTPAITNVYGIVYNYAVLPAALLFGSTFAVHRAASMVFLLIGAALLYGALRQQETARPLALAGTAFYYLFNVATYAIVARPDTLGNALYLAVIILVLPPRGRTAPSFAKMAASAALGVLAFYTKPYFVLSLGLAVATLTVTAGWRRAVVYAAMAGGLLLASLPVVQHIWPYYLFSIFTIHRYVEINKPGFFWHQFRDFLLLHSELLVVTAAGCCAWLAHTAATSRKTSGTWFSKWRLWSPDPWALCLGLSLLVVGAILSRHVGAFRIYWIQLTTPFLILVAVGTVARAEGRWQTLGLSLLAMNALVLLTWARPPWPEDSAPTWAAWDKLTAGHPVQLLPPQLLDAVPPHGLPVIDNGQTNYFTNVVLDHLPPSDPTYQRVTEYARGVSSLIQQRHFDVIVMPNDFEFYIPLQFLEEHYLPYEVQFPIYYLSYTQPSKYGQGTANFIAWIRKPGPEHAAATPVPAAPAKLP